MSVNNSLKLGDHIYIQRYNPINYTHHGIVVQVNPFIKIAHPCLNSKKQIKYLITDLKSFVGDLHNCIDYDVTDSRFLLEITKLKNKLITNPLCLVKINKYKKRLPVSQILELVYKVINNNTKYCIFTSNCEMFAQYCSTGVMPIVCDQLINNVTKIISGDLSIKNINTTIIDYVSTFVL